jgi:hypothetical protein
VVDELREQLVAEVVATQLTMIGGHGASKKPRSTDSPPPPPPGNNNPPPPPGGGGGPDNGPPPGGNPPPPVTGGPPQSPEPASLVTALVGAGLASLGVWRYRRRK